MNNNNKIILDIKNKMSEIRKSLDANFNGQGNNGNQLIPNQNNNYEYINQGFNNIRDPLTNNANIQINIDEIALPVQYQNNIDDDNKKYSISPPFTNDENITPLLNNDEKNKNNSIPLTNYDINQNIIISNNNNIQKNIEMNQNIDINLQNNQNINNNFQNNQNFNSNLNYNQSLNNNPYNNNQMNYQANSQNNEPSHNDNDCPDCPLCCYDRNVVLAVVIGAICGFIPMIVIVYLLTN